MHLKLILHRTITISCKRSLVIFNKLQTTLYCAGNFPTYLSHLYIKEWRPTSWIYRTHTKTRLIQQFKVPNSVIVLHLKSLRISYRSSFLRNSIVLRVCIWFILWTSLIVYQVFKLKQTSLLFCLIRSFLLVCLSNRNLLQLCLSIGSLLTVFRSIGNLL